MPLMFQTASSENHRQIPVGMPGAIAHATSQDDQRVVKHLCFFEAIQKPTKLSQQIFFHNLQVFQSPLVLAVMRKAVISAKVEFGCLKAHGDFKGYDPCRVCL